MNTGTSTLITDINIPLSKYGSRRPSVVTVGMFDGVHLGHRHMLSCLVEEASLTKMNSVVITFTNHPKTILRPETSPMLLTKPANRIKLIEATGVNLILQIDFDKQFSQISAHEFSELLVKRLNMKILIMGPDSSVGREREGDLSNLISIGNHLGFSVRQIDALKYKDNVPISSGLIRQALSDGDLSKVSTLLGRTFTIEGTVTHGYGRGSTLGFPTANLAVQRDMAIPGDGIYSTWAYLGNTRFQSATSIGVRPTFEGIGRSIETYIIALDSNLYGQKIKLGFVSKLRDEIKFDNTSDLKNQISFDVENAKKMLDGSDDPVFPI